MRRRGERGRPAHKEPLTKDDSPRIPGPVTGFRLDYGHGKESEPRRKAADAPKEARK